MPQHAFVVGARGFVPGREHDEQVVEILTPRGRPALHQLQVVGGEHGDAHQFHAIARPLERVTVELHTIAPGGANLGLEQLHPVAVDDLGSQHRGVGAFTDQRGVGHVAERLPGRRPRGRLEQAGLALRVRAADHGDARGELQLRLVVAPEVGEPQPGQMHPFSGDAR